MKGLRITVLVLMALTLISCGKKKQAAVVAQKPIPVNVAEVTKATLQINRVYTGTLEGWKQAGIYASIPEAVVELPVKAGATVNAGQTVIVLDREGRASQFRQVKAVYDEAKDNFEKMSRLYDQGAISQQIYNNTKTGYDVARANYESARRQVELTSPISGVLTDLSVNLGQYAPLGMPLATVAQTDKLRLTLFVDDRSVAALKLGQSARISTAAAQEGEVDIEGQIVEISRSADPETKLFRVEVQIENAAKAYSPGTFARATVTVRQLDDVLTVPREAVFFLEGIPKVYTVDDSSRAREHGVVIGEGTVEKYQIISGLSAGDKVITLGRSQVENGSLVKIVEAAGAVGGVKDSSKGQ
jgi:RND family efflux transporter MFP subunit